MKVESRPLELADWLVIAKRFGGRPRWSRPEDEADLLAVVVALEAAWSVASPVDAPVEFASSLAYCLLSHPPVQFANADIAYETIREVMARAGLPWVDTPDEGAQWDELVARSSTATLRVHDLETFIEGRAHRGD